MSVPSIRLCVAAALITTTLSGCNMMSGRRQTKQKLTASQLRSQELFAENEQLMMANNDQQMMIGSLHTEQNVLGQQLGQTQQQLATANARIDNLLAERSQLKDRYAQALTDTTTDSFGGTGTPAIPGFTYDPLTGLSKFPDDVLFDLGSDQIRAESVPRLREFANQVNSVSALGLRILIVGHTDDQQISRPSTAEKHATNWHLSTDRASQVITELEQMGIDSDRMSAMGYSRFQPLASGDDESIRQRNRRVELYVVPDSAAQTAWDPARSLH